MYNNDFKMDGVKHTEFLTAARALRVLNRPAAHTALWHGFLRRWQKLPLLAR